MDGTQQDVSKLVDMGSALIESILNKASHKSIVDLIEGGAPLWYQDEEGLSALHAACFNEDVKLVQLLIDKGAIWNAVDNQDNTAADIALSLNNADCYRIIRDAGIRSEFVLQLLESRDQKPEGLTLRAEDKSAFGSLDTFLQTRLRYTRDAHGQDICVMTNEALEEVGVMMGWERSIMQQTVAKLYQSIENSDSAINVLNVGFGLGIIDTLFQELPVRPANHVIIEPHPDVLQHMRETGWYTRPGVTILEGKWQDFVGSEQLLAFGGFDIIYTDTFSEDYFALKTFFDSVPDLTTGPRARFSFFNGLGATNATFYDVYTQVAELHLQDLGFNVAWYDVEVGLPDEKRWGNTREYFSLPLYRMPICAMAL